jgi:hypothetical protein
MSDWKDTLRGSLESNGFGKRRDFLKEISGWIKDWTEHLNANSTELIASYNKDYEGNVVVEVKKRVGDIYTLVPYKCKIRVEQEETIIIECVIGMDFKSFLSNGDEETKEKHYEWKKIENKGEQFLNEEFVLGKLNSYLESWMKSKNK